MEPIIATCCLLWWNDLLGTCGHCPSFLPMTLLVHERKSLLPSCFHCPLGTLSYSSREALQFFFYLHGRLLTCDFLKNKCWVIAIADADPSQSFSIWLWSQSKREGMEKWKKEGGQEREGRIKRICIWNLLSRGELEHIKAFPRLFPRTGEQ